MPTTAHKGVDRSRSPRIDPTTYHACVCRCIAEEHADERLGPCAVPLRILRKRQQHLLQDVIATLTRPLSQTVHEDLVENRLDHQVQRHKCLAPIVRNQEPLDRAAPVLPHRVGLPDHVALDSEGFERKLELPLPIGYALDSTDFVRCLEKRCQNNLSRWRKLSDIRGDHLQTVKRIAQRRE